MRLPAKTTANNGKKPPNRRGRPENLKPWPKGVSGNPAGAPKRGESWAEIIGRIGEMTDAEFIQLKRGQPTQKQQAVMAVYMALKNDPQPGVFNAIMDRTEGKVTEKLEVSDLRDKADSELISEFKSIVDAARARAGDSANG